MDNMLKLRPPCQMKGEIWDEKSSYDLVDILISHQKDCINSIQFTYRLGPKVVHSQIHGEPKGLNFNMVEFDYPDEALTWVSGDYKDGRLSSIVFGTNKGQYGPFGGTCSTPGLFSNTFKYEFKPRRFGGFYGSVEHGCVCGIGVYVKPYAATPPDPFACLLKP